jgi:outer membrane protein TolC
MKKNRLVYLITVLVFSFLSGPGFCQELAFVPVSEVYDLNLRDISDLALQNNLDIQMVKLDLYIQRNNLDITLSLFDTFFSIYANYLDDEKEVPNVFSGTKTKIRTSGIDITKRFPTGTDISLGLSGVRNYSNSSFFTENPFHEMTAKASLRQSLGKNFFGLRDRADIKITKLDIENFEFTTLDEIEQELSRVQIAYWRLSLAYDELGIRKNILDEAKKLRDTYKKNFEIGLIERPDLLASEANVKLRENEVAIADLELVKAQNDLLLLLSEENLDIAIKPADNLDTAASYENIYDALSQAVENRRDYKQAKNLLDISETEIVVKKNALWPQIDLEASYKRNGIDRYYRTAWDDISSQNQDEIYIGVTISSSFEQKKEKAELAQKKLEKQKSLLLLKQIEQAVFRQINSRVTEVNTLANEVTTNKEIVSLQEQKLGAESARLRYGRSSADIIIRYQEDVLNSRLNLARSLFNYRLSLIDLELAKNSLLDTYWQGEL